MLLSTPVRGGLPSGPRPNPVRVSSGPRGPDDGREIMTKRVGASPGGAGSSGVKNQSKSIHLNKRGTRRSHILASPPSPVDRDGGGGGRTRSKPGQKAPNSPGELPVQPQPRLTSEGGFLPVRKLRAAKPRRTASWELGAPADNNALCCVHVPWGKVHPDTPTDRILMSFAYFNYKLCPLFFLNHPSNCQITNPMINTQLRPTFSICGIRNFDLETNFSVFSGWIVLANVCNAMLLNDTKNTKHLDRHRFNQNTFCLEMLSQRQ